MKKVYFIFPILGAVIFFFFYAAVKNDLKASDEKRKADQAKEIAARAERDVKMRQEAYRIARADVDRRIAAALEREKEEARKAAETQAAKDARDLAYRERERQYKRLMELTDSRTVADEQLARVREQLQLQRIQSEYLAKAAKDVNQNKLTYEQVLQKMDAAEKADAAAAAAARAAAKKSN